MSSTSYSTSNEDITLEEVREKKGITEKVSDAVVSGLNKFGIPSEKIPGTQDYKDLEEALEEGAEVMGEWNASDTIYNELTSRATTDRSFYLGEAVEQGVSNLEGNIRVTANIGATFIDLFTYLLTNNAPSVQFAGEPDPVSQAEAAFKETMTKRLLADASWPKRFRDAGKTQFLVGYTAIYPFWNANNPLGGKRGSFDMSVINPFTTRIRYKSTDVEQPESFITSVRLSQAEILRRYDFEAMPDQEDPWIPKTNIADDDDKTTVFCWYGENEIRKVINGRVVEKIEHNLGFCPLVVINNIQVLNDVHGHSEIERWIGLAGEINALLSAISEVARDLAYPPIIEYNNALGGVTPNKWRGMKIPAKRSDRGEAIEYLVNNAQINPLIQQAKFLISLLHFVALMPEAAGGVFPANVTSGFQAKLSMQPATLTTDSRKIDWEWGLKQLTKMAFKILQKNDPSALKIVTPGKTVTVSDIYDHEMNVVWPENLPVDIAREIQNLTLGIQTGLTSLNQAIDRYNVLMGMGTTEETKDYLAQESDDATFAPDRALKVQTVRTQIAQALQALQQMSQPQTPPTMPGNMNEAPNALPGEMQPGGMENNPTDIANNMETGEPKVYPPTAREAVVPESTGGAVIPPIAQ